MRVVFLLRTRAVPVPAGWAAALPAETARLSAASGIAHARCGFAVHPVPNIAHSAVVAGRLDAFLEFWTPGGDIIDLEDLRPILVSMAARLATHVDASRSAVVAGTFHPIIDGDPNWLFCYPLRRHSALTRSQFLDYWLTTHGQDAVDNAAAPGGYGQLHADPSLSAQLAVLCGFGMADYDGVCEAGHHDLDDFTAFMNSSAVARGGIRLEAGFIDHTRSAFGLMDVRA